MVAYQLPKLGVAGSNPVARSNFVSGNLDLENVRTDLANCN